MLQSISAKGNMTVTPRNKVAMVGERVELECNVDRNSTVTKWEVTRYSRVVTNPTTVPEIETIARFDKIFGLALVNITHLGSDVDSTGSGVIYYNSTDLEDAANYTCSAHVGPHKDTIFYSAQLIVLGEYRKTRSIGSNVASSLSSLLSSSRASSLSSSHSYLAG